MEDDEEEVSMQRICVEDYLEMVVEAVDPSYRMCVSEQHRKKMIRCLMGYGHKKAEFDLKLQNVHLKEQWEKTAIFVKEHLSELQVDQTKAPMFLQGLQGMSDDDTDTEVSFFPQPMTTHQPTGSPQFASPHRFFSFLARGKTYQGKLLRLLEDTAPSLVPTYLDIARPKDQRALIRKLVLEESNLQTQDSSSSDLPPAVQWKDQLLLLVEKDFGTNGGAAQPEDGGKGMGLQGEGDLTTYLQQQQTADRLVLSNVYVKPPKKHKLNNSQYKKRIPHVILSNQLKHMGMTSEFDAMVLEPIVNSQGEIIQMRILQVWEAKASLHPISISDVLYKKVGALEQILADPLACIYFYPSGCDPEVRQVLLGDNSPISNPGQEEPLIFPLCSSKPQIGIYGCLLLDPRSAARRTQLVHCEQSLEESSEAVVEALETGSVAPPANVILSLQRLLDEARRLQPLLVVPSTGLSSS